MDSKWLDYKDKGSSHFSEPRNHCLAPGGSEYSRYLWVRSCIPQGARVLDVGCNCGQMAENLTKDLGCQVVGIDVIPEFVQHCQTDKAAYGQFLCADFGSMGEYEAAYLVATYGTFDVVLALEVLEHDISIRGFRCNLARVLRPGGLLVVTTPHPDSFLAEMRGAIPAHVRQWTAGRLAGVFGEPEQMVDIYRDECGRLLSIGAMFVQ